VRVQLPKGPLPCISGVPYHDVNRLFPVLPGALSPDCEELDCIHSMALDSGKTGQLRRVSPLFWLVHSLGLIISLMMYH
jgi:hypothetical protein